MPTYRVTFGFEGSNTGWTETHAFNSAQAGSPANVFPLAIQVAQLRVLFLGYPFQINAIRVSPYPKARAQLVRGPWFNPGFGPMSGSSEPAVVALESIAYAAANAPAGFANNQKISWLGAPPIQCLLFAGAGPGAGAVNQAALGLGNNFQAWKTALTSGFWGWLAVTPIAGGPLPIQDIVQLPTGQVQFTLANNTLVDGTIYNVRVSGVNSGRSPLNRQFIAVYLATGKLLITKEQVAFGGGGTLGQVQAYSRTNTFVPYGDMILSNQTIEHKRGKPFLSPRGRARKVVRW